jgi:RNA polymerase sigma factor (sigma-70 family)
MPRNTHISREAERELLQTFFAGVEPEATRARHALVEANMGLVWMLARRRAKFNAHIATEDLAQIGALRLFELVPKFDMRRKTRLASFAGIAIARVMDLAITTQRIVRTPASAAHHERTRRKAEAAQAMKSLNYTFKEFQTGEDYSTSEIQRHLIDPRPSHADILADDDDRRWHIAALRRAIATLPYRQQQVLFFRMEGITLHETGAMFGVSKERIRQIEQDAYAEIRRVMLLEKCRRRAG